MLRGLGVCREDSMGTLIFVCPASGQEVPTGLEMDPETLVSLRNETVRCPHCHATHRLSDVRASIAQRSDILSDEGLIIAA
jgi:hypothetical protein